METVQAGVLSQAIFRWFANNPTVDAARACVHIAVPRRAMSPPLTNARWHAPISLELHLKDVETARMALTHTFSTNSQWNGWDAAVWRRGRVDMTTPPPTLIWHGGEGVQA